MFIFPFLMELYLVQNHIPSNHVLLAVIVSFSCVILCLLVPNLCQIFACRSSSHQCCPLLLKIADVYCMLHCLQLTRSPIHIFITYSPLAHANTQK